MADFEDVESRWRRGGLCELLGRRCQIPTAFGLSTAELADGPPVTHLPGVLLVGPSASPYRCTPTVLAWAAGMASLAPADCGTVVDAADGESRSNSSLTCDTDDEGATDEARGPALNGDVFTGVLACLLVPFAEPEKPVHHWQDKAQLAAADLDDVAGLVQRDVAQRLRPPMRMTARPDVLLHGALVHPSWRVTVAVTVALCDFFGPGLFATIRGPDRDIALTFLASSRLRSAPRAIRLCLDLGANPLHANPIGQVPLQLAAALLLLL